MLAVVAPARVGLGRTSLTTEVPNKGEKLWMAVQATLSTHFPSSHCQREPGRPSIMAQYCAFCFVTGAPSYNHPGCAPNGTCLKCFANGHKSSQCMNSVLLPTNGLCVWCALPIRRHESFGGGRYCDCTSGAKDLIMPIARLGFILDNPAVWSMLQEELGLEDKSKIGYAQYLKWLVSYYSAADSYINAVAVFVALAAMVRNAGQQLRQGGRPSLAPRQITCSRLGSIVGVDKWLDLPRYLKYLQRQLEVDSLDPIQPAVSAASDASAANRARGKAAEEQIMSAYKNANACVSIVRHAPGTDLRTHSKYRWLAGVADGQAGSNTLIECKSRQIVANDSDLQQYMPQVQGLLEVWDMPTCDLVVHSLNDETVRVHEVRRDEKYFKWMMEPILRHFAAQSFQITAKYSPPSMLQQSLPPYVTISLKSDFKLKLVLD
jgi:hypothetical protein